MTNTSQTEIKGIQYDVGQINAFDQLFISRKTAPYFAKFDLENPITIDEALAEVPEVDMLEMFARFLPVTKRLVDKTWYPIYNKASNQILYQDITGHDLLTLLFFVIRTYVNPFLEETNPQE